MINNLERELEELRIDQQKCVERERNLLSDVEGVEKNFIREINDEQRRLSPFIPGFVPKIINYANIRNSTKTSENMCKFNALQIAFVSFFLYF